MQHLNRVSLRLRDGIKCSNLSGSLWGERRLSLYCGMESVIISCSITSTDPFIALLLICFVCLQLPLSKQETKVSNGWRSIQGQPVIQSFTVPLSFGKRQRFCLIQLGNQTKKEEKEEKKNGDGWFPPPYLADSFNLPRREEGEACHCPVSWTRDLFNFAPCFKAPSTQAAARPGKKLPFAFHFPPDKRGGENVVHCNALSPLWHESNWSWGERSIQIKSKYKNHNWEKDHYRVKKSIGGVWLLGRTLFEQGRTKLEQYLESKEDKTFYTVTRCSVLSVKFLGICKVRYSCYVRSDKHTAT